MNASDIMTHGIISIKRDAPVWGAMDLMVNRRVTSLIVEKEDAGGVYGMVTRRDVVNKVIAYGKDTRKMKVADIMSEPLLTISPEMSVETVARLMSKTNLRRFPVMVGDEIVGMVSNSDILKAVVLGVK
jgi:CBS domain-containing protein